MRFCLGNPIIALGNSPKGRRLGFEKEGGSTDLLEAGMKGVLGSLGRRAKDRVSAGKAEPTEAPAFFPGYSHRHRLECGKVP